MYSHWCVLGASLGCIHLCLCLCFAGKHLHTPSRLIASDAVRARFSVPQAIQHKSTENTITRNGWLPDLETNSLMNSEGLGIEGAPTFAARLQIICGVLNCRIATPPRCNLIVGRLLLCSSLPCWRSSICFGKCLLKRCRGHRHQLSHVL